MKFIVDRKTWYRGQGSELSKLLLKDGSRCCIGFVGQQVGIEDEAMRGYSGIQPCGIKVQDLWPKWMHTSSMNSSSALVSAYGANDDPDVSEAARESELKRIFEGQGDEIEFVG